MPQPVTLVSEGVAAASEAFSCAACGGTGGSIVLRACAERFPFDLHRCSDCGMVQQFPRWSAARLASLYSTDYYVFAETEAQRWSRAVQQYVVHLSRLESRPGLRLLDVGCAQGHLAALAKRRGWRVTGLDLSADAVSQAAVRFGLDVRAGQLSGHVGTLLPFDVVLLGDVIEHVADPVRFIADVRKVIAPGGAVCVDTPNWGGFWRHWGGSHWLGLNRYHVNFFDAESLPSLLAASGFRDVTIASYTHYRYEGWAARPEVQRWVNVLPKFLAWRIQRWLGRRNPHSIWSSLRIQPPASVDAAHDCIAQIAHHQVSPVLDHLHGDNLVAVARR